MPSLEKPHVAMRNGLQRTRIKYKVQSSKLKV